MLLLHTFCARQADVVVVAAVVIVLSRCVDAFGPIHRRVSQLLFHVFLSRFFSFVFHSQALVSATFGTSATFLCTLYSYCTVSAYDLSPTSNRSSKKYIRAEAPTLQAPLERERGGSFSLRLIAASMSCRHCFCLFHRKHTLRQQQQQAEAAAATTSSEIYRSTNFQEFRE